MSRTRRRTAAIVVGVGLAGSAVALAVAPSVSQEEVSTTITFTHAKGYDRFCGSEEEGETGLDEHAIVYGTATGDPRLSGDVEMHVRLLQDYSGSAGTQVGTLRIRNAQTGRWSAQGRFAIAGDDPVMSGGFVGTVRDPANGGGTTSDLIGPF